MAFVAVTRLRLRSLRFLPFLLFNNWKSSRQVRSAPGFLGGQLLIDRRLTFWTMTVWSDLDSMRMFRNNGAHQRVMPRLAHWCSESSSVHWEQARSVLPDWLEAYDRMIENGHEVPVENRSSTFNLKKIPVPRFSVPFVQILKPYDK